MEGFAGSVPQGFIDRSIKICPFCGSSNPHWAIDQKMQMKLEGNLYLFQCEQCKGVLSAPVPDVTGFNNTPTIALLLSRYTEDAEAEREQARAELESMTDEELSCALENFKHEAEQDRLLRWEREGQRGGHTKSCRCC